MGRCLGDSWDFECPYERLITLAAPDKPILKDMVKLREGCTLLG